VEGKAGILKALGTSMSEVRDHRSRTVKNAWRTYGQVILHNGIVVYIDSAAEGGLRIQGRNLKGAWADEVGLWDKWETCWNESLRYAVREGRSQIIATGTPKAARPARKLVRSLIRNDPGEGGVVVTRLRTVDNAANLLDSVRVPGHGQEGGPRLFREIKIGVDPSDGSETSDEQAYTAVGLGMTNDPHPLYVMENWGGQEAPVPFAKRVILRSFALAEAYSCPVELIIEKNHGGAWLTATFQQVMKQMKVTCRYRVIHASQAKRTRAEPCSALYEMHGGLVRHCHAVTTSRDGHPVPDQNMPELEDQMATFTGAQGERSPDRLDSAVWALTPFLKRSFGPPGRHGPRDWAAQAELDSIGPDREPGRRKRLSTAHGGAYADESDDWGLDGFAPRDDRDAQVKAGPRGNIKTWR
jgi:phage terminase large subunit-like protein